MLLNVIDSIQCQSTVLYKKRPCENPIHESFEDAKRLDEEN